MNSLVKKCLLKAGEVVVQSIYAGVVVGITMVVSDKIVRVAEDKREKKYIDKEIEEMLKEE